jgi:hypothetical protein
MPELPSQFYWILGVVIMMNLGTIASMILAAGKGLWWLSKLDGRVSKNTVDVDHAHEKIRSIQKHIYKGDL